MTLCREWSLVKRSPWAIYGKPLICRSWSCPECRPLRKAQLLALAASGQPNRFLTLTINPRVGTSQEDRARLLRRALALLIKRIRRRCPGEPVEYLSVTEETKQGEPHLHVLLRSPFIPQKFVSAVMRELVNSPIVDIRKVRDVHQVVLYVAKYIAKAPAQFGNAKRYWRSQAYEVDKQPWESTAPEPGIAWTVDRRPLVEIIREWTFSGFASRCYAGETVVGFPTGSWALWSGP